LSDEIHVFRAEATVGPGAMGRIPGRQHSLMLFLRQPHGTDHDWSRAETILREEGWLSPSLSRAGTLPMAPKEGIDQILAAAHTSAAEKGHSVVIYDPNQ
jgi:hypothetical protein